MLENVLDELASLLLGAKMPAALQLLMSTRQPNPKYKEGMTRAEKAIWMKAVNKYLLGLSVGKSLVTDLFNLNQSLDSNLQFNITFYVNIDKTLDGKKAYGPGEDGYADMEDKWQKLKKDIGIYVKVSEGIAAQKTPNDNSVTLGAEPDNIFVYRLHSREGLTACTLYHEMLHVWFTYKKFDADDPIEDPGAPFGHDSEHQYYSERFKDRLVEFYNQVSELEQKIE